MAIFGIGQFIIAQSKSDLSLINSIVTLSVRANVRVRTEPYLKVRTERSVRFVFGKNTCSDRTFGPNIKFIKNEK